MRPLKNGRVVEYLSRSIGSYLCAEGDEYECPVCGHRIVTGIALSPIKEHWQPDYTAFLDLPEFRSRVKCFENLAHREQSMVKS
jgi:hypothetical protein